MLFKIMWQVYFTARGRGEEFLMGALTPIVLCVIAITIFLVESEAQAMGTMCSNIPRVQCALVVVPLFLGAILISWALVLPFVLGPMVALLSSAEVETWIMITAVAICFMNTIALATLSGLRLRLVVILLTLGWMFLGFASNVIDIATDALGAFF